MKTLRDEWARLYPDQPQRPAVCRSWPVSGPFLNEYGDYRVVEGRLTTKCGHRKGGNTRIVIVGKGVGASECWTEVGYTGDIVTLILPPEEKEPADKVMLRLMAAKEEALQREAIERLRADRYEKALRQIARPAVEDRNVYSAYHRRTRIAREALDDTDS